MSVVIPIWYQHDGVFICDLLGASDIMPKMVVGELTKSNLQLASKGPGEIDRLTILNIGQCHVHDNAA